MSTTRKNNHHRHRRGGHLEGSKNGQKLKLSNTRKGGIAVGAKHGAEGGIQGNVGTHSQPIEFEGEEVIINARSVKSKKRKNFEGRKMTNRQILSAINSEDGNGVSFAKGGIPSSSKSASCACKHRSFMHKGGRVYTHDELAVEFAKVKNPNSYILDVYGGRGEEILKFVQEQSTGMDANRRSAAAPGSAYQQVLDMIGNKQLVLRAVSAIPQAQKDMILKAWKGYNVPMELRNAIKSKAMALGGVAEHPTLPVVITSDTPKNSNYFRFYQKGGIFARGGKIRQGDQKKMTYVEFFEGLEQLRPFIPISQFIIIGDIFRGEEKGYAIELLERFTGIINKMPQTYETENVPKDEKIVYLRYFYGGSDWYIIEKDKGDEEDEIPGLQQQAYGFAILNGNLQDAGWGYISIEELRSDPRIELDFDFDPIPFGQLVQQLDPDEPQKQDTSIIDSLDEFSYHSVDVPLSAKSKKLYDQNESNNLRSENMLLLAELSGNEKLINAAKYLVKKHDQEGHATPEINELHSRLQYIMNVKHDSAKPSVKTNKLLTSTDQQNINNQVRQLVQKYGADRSKYSAEDIALLKLYEGAGIEKATSTDVRILDQFFTPAEICSKMWGLAIKHGFTFNGSAIAELSVGSGRFLHYIPADADVYVRGYDVDEVCATICKVLFPKFDIRHASFESMFFKGRRHIGLAGMDRTFNLVIGNPPYREYISEYAPLGEKEATGAATFEMYFIARGVDILEKNGLLILIIPNTFLSNDNKYNSFKEKLAQKCDLIDAYRLPNGVFKNTDIGTDIIVLRKK